MLKSSDYQKRWPKDSLKIKHPVNYKRLNISMLELNELDVVDCRKVNFIPPHFVKIRIGNRIDNNIELWIKNRLRNRYAVSITSDIDDQNRLTSVAYAAFEDQKELTYFMLACPYLRRL
jgi:hypothetical protein